MRLAAWCVWCAEMAWERGRTLSPGTPPLIGAIPELEDYTLKIVRTNGRSLGAGAYGSVEELDVNGVACAGKIIHEILLQPDTQGVNSLSERFVEECKLMSRLRHPHVVQFLGVCQLNSSRLPVLVMELLMTSLDALLSKHPDIPIALKSSMLYDVAKGLTYLHEQQDGPIIHRDLTARNVLLDSALKAKIADFGVARIVNLSGREVATMSRLPGTLVYMAPECSSTIVRYNSKLDIFSFGVLALFTITQEFPADLLSATYNDPMTGRLLGRSEVDRRRMYVDQAREQLGGGGDLRPEYKLVEMMELCLQNDPELRPTVTVLLAVLRDVCECLTDPYLSMHKLQLIEELARLKEGREVQGTGINLEDREASVGVREARVQEREEAVAVREREPLEREAGEREAMLVRQVQEVRTELDNKERQNQELCTELENKNAELEFRDRHIEQLEHWQDPQLPRLQEALRQAEAAVEAKDRDLATLLSRMEKQELNFRDIMAHKEVDCQKMNEQLATTASQLRKKELELQEIQEKTRAMSDELTNIRTKLNSSSKEQQVLPRPPQPSGLRVQLPVTWRVREPIHFGTNAAQSVTLNGKVIVGGGDVPGDNARKVAFYDPGTRKWGDLGLYSHQLFAMAVVGGDLLLVGGYDVVKDDYTGIVSKYNRDSKYWQQCYPDMPTARSEPAAVGFRHWLVVAGGYNGVSPLAEVEILNTLTSQWQTADPLPLSCTALQPAAYLEEGQDTWYLLGGGEGLRSQRPAFCTLLSQLVRGDAGVWRKIPEPPYSCSGAVTVRGYLVAMGGRDQQGQKKGGIHAFLPGTCEWLHVADLPTPRYGCTCATLPSGRLLVVGGREERDHSTRVDMATITGI